MAILLTDLEKVFLSVAYTSAAGNPAAVEGLPVWASSNEGVVTLEVTEDGYSAYAVTVGPVGTAQVSVSADADLGEGIRPLVATLDVTVIGSEAVFAGLITGAPEPK